MSYFALYIDASGIHMPTYENRLHGKDRGTAVRRWHMKTGYRKERRMALRGTRVWGE